jgi:hypothetical protein
MSDLMSQDGVQTDAVDDASTTVDGGEVTNTTKSTVLRKFARMCPDRGLQSLVDSAVQRSNIILAEAYEFANFHLHYQLHAGAPLPKIDDNFYYACLSSVSNMATRSATIPAAIKQSSLQFDRLRAHGEEKIYAHDLMDIMQNLRKVMATAAKNHLWTNVTKRTRRWLKFKHPGLKKLHGAIVAAVFVAPTVKLTDFNAFKEAKEGLSACAIHMRAEALGVAASLRAWYPFRSGKRVDSRSHELIPLYWKLFQDTEVHFEQRRGEAAKGLQPGRTPLRRFTILPRKNGFTASYIPIHTRAMLKLVTTLKDRDGNPRQTLSKCVDKVHPEESDKVWRKWFNINSIETKSRRFGHLILTDGCGARVVLDKPSAHILSTEATEASKFRISPTTLPVQLGGVDPGISDIVTVAHQAVDTPDTHPTISSYSSSRYYEKAKYKVSGRRTSRWNRQTSTLTDSLQTAANLGTEEGMSESVRAYMAVVRRLTDHRMRRGYRNMRFMRAVHKQKAVDEIVDIVAPRGWFTVVGYGDWQGSGSSPISRRFSGPQQDIKRELMRTNRVAFGNIDEFRTSVLCNETWQRMENMVAVSHTRDRTGEMVLRQKSKIHKVLHCKISVSGARRTKTTWNRDVNAALNMLMLLKRTMRNEDRPTEFSRNKIAPRRCLRRVGKA